MTRRNQHTLLKLKTRQDIIKRETALSDRNSKTVDLDAFKDNVRAKNRLNEELRLYYGMKVHRKMKWRHFVYTQRSEDRFLGRMRRLYGDNPCVRDLNSALNIRRLACDWIRDQTRPDAFRRSRSAAGPPTTTTATTAEKDGKRWAIS
jgi:hypothetical protein